MCAHPQQQPPNFDTAASNDSPSERASERVGHSRPTTESKEIGRGSAPRRPHPRVPSIDSDAIRPAGGAAVVCFWTVGGRPADRPVWCVEAADFQKFIGVRGRPMEETLGL